MGLDSMAIDAAQRDLQTVTDEIAALKERLSDLQAQAIKIANFIEMSAIYSVPQFGPNQAPEAPAAPPVATGRPVLKKRSVPVPGEPPLNVRVAIEILRERGQPMMTRVLVDELAKRGTPTGGKIPVTNLSSALSRFKSLLVSDRSEGWSLREWFSDPDPADDIDFPHSENLGKPETDRDFIRESAWLNR